MRTIIGLLALAKLFSTATCDLYMHSPRGSNDRCDEVSNDRNNANLLFNSQNNAAGGYAVCPSSMQYYTGTDITFEYTSQHGCGNGGVAKNDPSNPEFQQCQVIIQVGCDDTFRALQPTTADGTRFWPYALKNQQSMVTTPTEGQSSCTQTRPTFATCVNDTEYTGATNVCAGLDLSTNSGLNTFNSNQCQCSPRKIYTYALHEPEISWSKCTTRRGMGGLFLADQNLNGNTAAFTRQDNNGGNDRHGFECTEERDYYPYWSPTGWMDIVVKTSDTTQCAYYQANSENVVSRSECVNPNDPLDATAWQYNSQAACLSHANTSWVYVNATNKLGAPDCVQHEWSMDNHLGMGVTGASTANQASYKWTIPDSLLPAGADSVTCVARIRYNISTAEIPFFATNANNGAVKTNPVIALGNISDPDPMKAVPIRHAINTAQYGRTFQDRSYAFKILRRPSSLQNVNIHNLNVRGKRGNIAQVRNCVEYDFVPQTLRVTQGDMVHFQWCGSDFNDQGNDGQGRAGTDRSNIVPTITSSSNVGQPLVNTSMFAFNDMAMLAFQNQSNCFSVQDMLTTQATNANSPQSCHFLNAASPYFNYMAQVQNAGVFTGVSARNNAFSNRKQAVTIVADPASLDSGAKAGIAVGASSAVGLGAAGVLLWYKRKHGSLQGLKFHIQGKV
ncbi:hypothetical protein SmJEL517_g05375 [Synchytrium microbalum]|uniref:Uncharacterized protein n=1 Tax=Synchytrium microbalum TaxID=1806994 RepID=A0A507BWJ3_9FUNG|nr:uncharacterized protein SmJEL517_g05375 [Synchytrium microbalum]TPX31259.1 hypothetical protein SmJEL517_g05375 [Synchytrium microbalum]